MFDQETLDRLNAGVPPPGEPGTAVNLAVVEFEAISKEVSSFFETSPWAERSVGLCTCLRFAAHFVQFTKPELVEAVRKILPDEDGADGAYFETIEAFESAIKDCHAYADLLTAAQTRLLIAGAVIGLEPDDDEVQP
jgi:hypothetical protein